jgi:hypothetical protein
MRPERAAGRRIIAPRINYVALGTKRPSASVGHEVLRPGELGWHSAYPQIHAQLFADRTSGSKASSG